MCLETSKNPLSSDFRKLIFGMNVKPMLFGLSGVAYFVWSRKVKNAMPVTSELFVECQ